MEKRCNKKNQEKRCNKKNQVKKVFKESQVITQKLVDLASFSGHLRGLAHEKLACVINSKDGDSQPVDDEYIYETHSDLFNFYEARIEAVMKHLDSIQKLLRAVEL